MKCILPISDPDLPAYDKTVRRVPNEDAARAVKTGLFRYVPKREWKAQNRANQA